MTKQIVRDSTGCYHIKQATDRDILDLAANILKEHKLKDVAITHRLRKALELIEVRVLDHFLVTPDMVVSFAESGKI